MEGWQEIKPGIVMDTFEGGALSFRIIYIWELPLLSVGDLDKGRCCFIATAVE